MSSDFEEAVTVLCAPFRWTVTSARWAVRPLLGVVLGEVLHLHVQVDVLRLVEDRAELFEAPAASIAREISLRL